MLCTNVKFKRVDNNAIEPKYGTDFAAGADLYAVLSEPITIKPGETTLIKTGISMEVPDGLVALIFARSGLACKQGLAPANKVGVIDSDYRGEIMVALHNHSEKIATVEPGERVAQLAIVPFLKAEFEEADDLTDTTRGAGGFGSTGK